MDIYLKAESSNYTTATIKILRQYTSESMAEIKNRLTHHLPLLYIDTLEDDPAKVLVMIEELEGSGLQLGFYEAGREEDKMDKTHLLNLFQMSKEISNQTSRTIEMEVTEIVVVVDKKIQLVSSYTLISEDHVKAYYLFSYSEELINFINNEKHSSIGYYKRGKGEENKEDWDLTNPEEILILMGL